MNKVLPMLLLLFATQFAISATTAPVSISLKKSAIVSDSVVRLKDVAELSAASLTGMKKLENTVIAVAPLPGRTISISMIGLKKQLSGKRLSFRLTGENEVLVSTRHTNYPADRYLAYADKILNTKLSDTYVDLDLKPVGVYKDLELPVGAVRLDVKKAENIVLNKRTQISLLVFVNNRLFTLLPIWFEVNAKMVTYKALQDLDKFEELDRSMVEPVLLDIAAVKTDPIRFQSEFKGYTATTSIRSGDILTVNNVSNKHIILKGQDVEVISQSGPITLKFTATALQNGVKGDLIKIMNKKTKKSFMGQVVAAHTVRSI